MSLNADQYRLPEADHRALFATRIGPRIFANANTVAAPVAIIFGGQPGSGKSSAVDAALQELAGRGGAAAILGDELRDFHPMYRELMRRDDKTAAFYTDRDSGKWVEMAIDHAKAQRCNIVIEGTMRNSDTVAATMKGLRAAGFAIDARVVAVNDKLSWQGILQRYEGQRAARGVGRMTTPKAHQDAYVGLPGTLERIEREQLADRVAVFRRGLQPIYSNSLEAGRWLREPTARAAVEEERARPLTLRELRNYSAGYDMLASQVNRPERGATPEEVKTISELCASARCALAAEVFLREPKDQAIRQFPTLAGAYLAMTAFEKFLGAQGVKPEVFAKTFEAGRNDVAARIERGETPQVRLKTPIAFPVNELDTAAPSRDR